MTDQGIYTILTKAAMSMHFEPTCGPRLMNCWLQLKLGWRHSRKLNTFVPSLPPSQHQVQSSMSTFDGSNETGVFHVRFQHRQYYYFTQEGIVSKSPIPSLEGRKLLKQPKMRLLFLPPEHNLLVLSQKVRWLMTMTQLNNRHQTSAQGSRKK